MKFLQKKSAEKNFLILTSQTKSAISSITYENLQFHIFSVNNNIYSSRTSLCLVKNVLFENSDKIITHQNFDFKKWMSILKKNCKYIFKKHIFYYKYNDCALIIENDWNFKATVNLMYHCNDEVLNFEMSNQNNDK